MDDLFNFISGALWAKKSDKNSLFQWLPLKRHLNETGQIASLIWEHWLSPGQKSKIQLGFNDKSKAKELVVFLSCLHDIGKATPAFQYKKGFSRCNDLDDALLEKLEKFGFNGLSNLELSSPDKSHHALAGEYILGKMGVNLSISAIIGAHHGRPTDSIDQIKKQKYYECNYYQSEDSSSLIYQKWNEQHKLIYEWALKSSGLCSLEGLPIIPKSTQILISGIIIMADWIASNEDYFPLISIDSVDVKEPDFRIERAWNLWQKSDLYSPEHIEDSAAIFKERFGFLPNQLQQKAVDIINSSKSPGLVLIEASMGGGKTEASLFCAEELSYKNGRSGIYFCLPTQATSDGVFPRVLSWLKNLARNEFDNYSIRLNHGKSALNENFKSIATGVNSDQESYGSVIINEWFSGRKTSVLDDFVVGTVDNFLMTALKQKHLSLRHLGFSKKVIIIDEVHAYDAYMNQYLLTAIQWMAAYGVPIILLSATLSIEIRKEIVKSYLQGLGVETKLISSKLSQLDTLDYPLISYTDGSNVKVDSNFKKSKSKNIQIIKIQSDDILSIKSIIEKLIQSEGVIGVIVNTVRRAQEIAELIKNSIEKEIVEILHSNFISTERTEKEKFLMQIIGKNADRPKRKIIIGTQVIEQSLDIDFDILITDLAPMDLLIQRIGRLHRHNINRPPTFETPITYVVGVNDEFEFNKGSSYVYGDYILARTQHYLPNNIELPSDISELVQKTYEFMPLEGLSESNADKYNEFERQHIERLRDKKIKANHYKIDNVVKKNNIFSKNDTIIGIINNKIPNESEESANAQVRDTDSCIEIIALQEKGNGYGFFDSDEDISIKINDHKIAKKIASQTLKLPRILSVYNFDKTIKALEMYNINRLPDWQKSNWLRGSLGIIFNEKGEFELNNIVLKYSREFGLSYEYKKEIENE